MKFTNGLEETPDDRLLASRNDAMQPFLSGPLLSVKALDVKLDGSARFPHEVFESLTDREAQAVVRLALFALRHLNRKGHIYEFYD